MVDTLSGLSGDVYWTFRYVDKAGDHELAILSLDTAAQTLPDERYITLHDLYVQLQTWAFEAPGLGELPVERIEVMVVTSVEAGSVAGFDPAPWPLDQTVAELPEYLAGIRCTVATGSDVVGLRDLFTSLPADTPFAEGDQWHAAMARALVPGEPGCRLPHRMTATVGSGSQRDHPVVRCCPTANFSGEHRSDHPSREDHEQCHSP